MQFNRSQSRDSLVAAAAAEGAISNASSNALSSPVLLPANGTASHEPPVVEDAAVSTSSLLNRFDVRPTGSRLLQGLRDAAMLVLISVPFLVLRAVRYILVWLGITEHKWKGAATQEPLSKEQKQQLNDVIVMLRSNKLPDAVLKQAVAGVSSGTSTHASTRMLAHLYAVTRALDQVAASLDLNYDQARQQAVLMKLADVMERFAAGDEVDALDVLKALRRTTKHCVRDIAASSQQQRSGSQAKRQARAPAKAVELFVFKLVMEMSRAQPPSMQHVLLELPDGGELVETCKLIPLDMGVAFLSTQGPRFALQLEFMTQFHLFRPSDAKKRAEVQAMTINARVHSLHLRLKNGSMQEVASVLRSGGFATHGRHPRRMGLAGLTEMAGFCQQADPAMRQAVLSEVGFVSVEALEEELEARKGCCIAQALPVVVQGIKDMCSRPACLQSAIRSGSFLYVQQSLLSDLNPREGAYLQDLKGGLDQLSQRLQIRFVFKPERALEAQGRQIILYLDRDLVPDAAVPLGVSREELLSRPYTLTTAVFNCGVNVLQSLGFFMPAAWGDITQDICNRQALESLNDYARQAGLLSSPGLQALNRHYSPGSPRAAKDVESIWLARAAAQELGGCRAINCKSGKDRTAMELALSFTQEATQQLKLSPLQQTELLEALQAGLSYSITSQNNGRPSAYAFTEFELVTMPRGFAPAWKLCGKVDT